jgi:hypothetical protein
MDHRRVLGALAASCVTIAVGAGDAAAGTVSLDRGCYSPGDTVTETGAGF